MEKTVLDLRSALIAGTGGLIIVLTALFSWGDGGLSQWLLLLGGGLSIGGALWFRKRLREPDREWEQARQQLLFDQEFLDEERQVLDLMKADLEEEALMLEKRRHSLSMQLAQTVGFWDMDLGGNDGNQNEPEDIDLRNRQDHQVMAICREQSERMFNKITNNEYVVDGKLQGRQIADDALRLFESVARVYRPDSDQPLFETSVEQLLRFAHSTSMQLLIQLEQFPLDVKRFNLRDTYRFIKRAMDYYGMYRKVSPYWNYAKPAIFLGRLSLGANPIALGIGWTLTELASIGGKRLSTRYTRKYGLRMFHEAIRILGSEAAASYGARFRQRDPDWHYALELIDLVHQFPPSRSSLEQSLKEIGSLPLRGEYDRVFLYRCLANRFSARPEIIRKPEQISMGARVRIVQRLENFYTQHYAGEDPDRVKKWKRSVETRLAVRMRLDGETAEGSRDEQLMATFYSVFSYLLGHKMLELESAESVMRNTRTATAMEAAALSQGLLTVRESPPMVFDYPELTPSDEVLEMYLDDLIDCQLGVFPRETDSALIEEAAVYFRQKSADWVARLQEKCQAALLEMLPPEVPRPVIEAPIVHALLHDLGADEKLQILFPVSEVEGVVAFKEELGIFWLIGTSRRPLILFGFPAAKDAAMVHPTALWKPGSQAVSCETVKGLLNAYRCLSGGAWNPEAVAWEGSAPRFRVKGRRSGGTDRHFAALDERLRQLGVRMGADTAKDADLEGYAEPVDGR